MTMNRWVSPIGLRANLRIGTSAFLSAHNDLPDWIAFLLWAGWWMRSNARPEARLHLVTLLPARSCCATITALGACLASTQEELDGLDFRDFMALPDGAHVSLRDQGKIFQGALGPCDRYEGQSGRKVALDTGLKRWKGSLIWVFEHNLSKYQVSTDQRKNLSPQRQAAFERVERFYRTVDPRAKTGWCLSACREVLIVTSKAAWQREIENVSGQIDDNETPLVVPLADLVVATEEQQGFPGKTLLASPSGVMSNTSGVRVAILDGPDSIRAAENVNADAVLILIEHSECDENALHEIASMTDVREDDAVPEGLPDRFPAGIEVSVFGWRKQR